MPAVNIIKGMQSVRTMGKVKSSAIPDKSSDYLKLYMLEKERTRLEKERKRLLSRLESVETRLKDIKEFYDNTEQIRNSTSNPEQDGNKRKKKDNVKPKWKTMSIDY